MIGRLGGDEFAVLLTNTSLAESDRAVQHLAQSVRSFNQNGQRQYALSFSVGAVQFDPKRHFDVSELLQQADALMYQNKKAARAQA